MNWIKNILSRIRKRQEVPIKKDPVIFTTGGGWGDSIQWMDRQAFSTPTSVFRVVGWKSNMPEKGDILKSPMKSGKTAEFVFLKVDYCGDPRDMFFADVGFIGYEEVK